MFITLRLFVTFPFVDLKLESFYAFSAEPTKNKLWPQWLKMNWSAPSSYFITLTPKNHSLYLIFASNLLVCHFFHYFFLSPSQFFVALYHSAHNFFFRLEEKCNKIAHENPKSHKIQHENQFQFRSHIHRTHKIKLKRFGRPIPRK